MESVSLWSVHRLELIGTDAAEMTVAARWVVELLDIVRDVGYRKLPVSIDSFLMRSVFRLPKKNSATALSQQFPRRLMLGSRRFARQKRCHVSLPFCVPWSE